MDNRRLAGAVVLVAAAAVTVFNLNAYRHAVAMVRFGEQGAVRTGRPDRIGWLEKARVLVMGIDLPRPMAEAFPEVPYRTIRFPTSDGLTLEAWYVPAERPKGTAIVLHGYAGEKSSMLTRATALRELGWSCLLVDFRGVGGSDGRETTLGWKEAEDVLAAVRFTRAAFPGKTAVYGVSMGAVAALRALGPLGAKADVLIIESPYDTLERTTRARFTMMGLPSWPAADALLFWGGLHAGFSSGDFAPMAFAETVTAPTLVFHGAGDRYVSEEDAHRVAMALPKGTLVVFPDCGHSGFLKADPEKWRSWVSRALASA
ncbi:MAG: alpha/beta fold hydrolase [Elusimicrobia bacterium]|nr:alpha/beta fold hydrolase [Elusimicrobiota bacterium]